MNYRAVFMCLKLIEQSKPLKRLLWGLISIGLLFGLGPLSTFIRTLHEVGLF